MTFQEKLERFKAAKKIGGVVNYTPHDITVGDITYPPCGIVARVEESYETVGETCEVKQGKVKFYKGNEEFPLQAHEFDGTVNIVSAMVFEQTKNWMTGVWVSPATGHPDVVRNAKGQIFSVPAFRLL